MTIEYAEGSRKVGSAAVYSCTEGNVPSGENVALTLDTFNMAFSVVRTCLADGSWEGTAPTTCIVRYIFHPILALNTRSVTP